MDLTVDDLMQECVKCNGAGEIERKPERQGGYGTRVVWASPVQCDACSGVGYKLTETGKAIGKLINLLDEKPQLKRMLIEYRDSLEYRDSRV